MQTDTIPPENADPWDDVVTFWIRANYPSQETGSFLEDMSEDTFHSDEDRFAAALGTNAEGWISSNTALAATISSGRAQTYPTTIHPSQHHFVESKAEILSTDHFAFCDGLPELAYPPQ
jgi:hypothetical protein